MNELDDALVVVIVGLLYSDPSDIVILRNLSSRHRLTLLVSPANIDFTQDNLRCLLVDQPVSRGRLPDLVDPSSALSQSATSFFLSDYRATHLTTGSASSTSKTHGFIKIYQSRMNIDLFVFFSVFFSSFFLFLSIGICFWKVKFAYEIHRRRRTLKHEYHKRMARPFAKIQLFIKPPTVIPDDEQTFQQVRLALPRDFTWNERRSCLSAPLPGGVLVCRYSITSAIHAHRYRLLGARRRCGAPS